MGNLSLHHPAEQSVHAQLYNREVGRHMVTTDPPSRLKIEEELAELKERDEGRVHINDQGSFCSTLRERSVTNLSSRAQQTAVPDAARLKSRDFFRDKLRAQNIVKRLPLVAPSHPGAGRAGGGQTGAERHPQRGLAFAQRSVRERPGAAETAVPAELSGAVESAN